MKTNYLKTTEQVKSEFMAAGITVSEWARTNGFHRMVVVGLLRNAHQGLRGESHRCAVALGLKEGTVVDVAKFKPAPSRRGNANASQIGAAV